MRDHTRSCAFIRPYGLSCHAHSGNHRADLVNAARASGLVGRAFARVYALVPRACRWGTRHLQIGMQATAMGSQAVVAGAMKTSAGAMANMNKQLDVVGMQQTMRQYERQQAKMELTQEMMDDTLDAMFGDEDSDVDDVVNSVCCICAPGIIPADRVSRCFIGC